MLGSPLWVISGIIFSKKRIPYFIALITGVILVILLVVFYASNF